VRPWEAPVWGARQIVKDVFWYHPSFASISARRIPEAQRALSLLKREPHRCALVKATWAIGGAAAVEKLVESWFP